MDLGAFRHVGMSELRRRFSYYLRMVAAGETIVITKRGTPIALMRPLTDDEKKQWEDENKTGAQAKKAQEKNVRKKKSS